MAAEAAKQAKEEHRKQAQIESDLHRKLAEQIDREKEKIRRDKEAHEQKAKNAAWNKVVGKHHLSPAVQAGAKAIALKKGRKLPILADFSEFHRVGRLRPDDLRPDDHPRTSPVTSTSLKPCTRVGQAVGRAVALPPQPVLGGLSLQLSKRTSARFGQSALCTGHSLNRHAQVAAWPARRAGSDAQQVPRLLRPAVQLWLAQELLWPA